MKKLFGIGCGLLLLFLIFVPQESEKYGFTKSITVPKAVFDPLQAFLKTGKVEKDGWKIDFSEIQNVKVSSGKSTFSPPAKISGKVGFVSVGTTITEIRATANDSIVIDIDTSPIDLEIKPE